MKSSIQSKRTKCKKNIMQIVTFSFSNNNNQLYNIVGFFLVGVATDFLIDGRRSLYWELRLGD